jgi:peptide methionine sulfoxide reductase MsrA
MRQGNDVGTQYRSAIYTSNVVQLELAEESRDMYQRELDVAGFRPITTEIVAAEKFYIAEEYHQQYLAKNLNGYQCHRRCLSDRVGGLRFTRPRGFGGTPTAQELARVTRS